MRIRSSACTWNVRPSVEAVSPEYVRPGCDRIVGLEPSEQALEYALETFPDAEITALYVVPAPRGYWGAFEDPEARIPDADEAKARGRELLEEASATAADRDREIETELDIGEPDHVIVGRATDGEYDSIVPGSHGREGVSRILLGSVRKSAGFRANQNASRSDDVAETVVRRSPTPVVVVR